MPVGRCPTVLSQGQLDWVTAAHDLTLTCVKICYAEVLGEGEVRVPKYGLGRTARLFRSSSFPYVLLAA